MQLYAYDFSEFINLDVGEKGLFAGGTPIASCWVEPWRHAYLARADGRIAGFAIVDERSRLTGDRAVADVAEFFVLRRYRRLGVGSQAAMQAFARFSRRWEVRETASNAPAIAFWRRTISTYTDGNWRPLRVQAFMVEHTDQLLRRTEPELTDAERRERVLTYWAPPCEDPARPPPHCTGAAIDLTLVDAKGQVVNMGSPFDEPTERSHPHHFATATDASGREAHVNRTLLDQAMRAAGFVGHPQEWWHFSHGDRAWAREHDLAVARYGRTEPQS